MIDLYIFNLDSQKFISWLVIIKNIANFLLAIGFASKIGKNWPNHIVK